MVGINKTRTWPSVLAIAQAILLTAQLRLSAVKRHLYFKFWSVQSSLESKKGTICQEEIQKVRENVVALVWHHKVSNSILKTFFKQISSLF